VPESIPHFACPTGRDAATILFEHRAILRVVYL
jgi:hypothetical protein